MSAGDGAPLAGLHTAKGHTTDFERTLLVLVGKQSILPERGHTFDFDVRPEPPASLLNRHLGKQVRDRLQRGDGNDRWASSIRVVRKTRPRVVDNPDLTIQQARQKITERLAVVVEMKRPSRNAVAGPDPDGRNIEPEVSSNLVKFGNSLEVDEFAVRLDQSKPTIPLQRAGIQHVR